jgi:hypothetical protein
MLCKLAAQLSWRGHKQQRLHGPTLADGSKDSEVNDHGVLDFMTSTRNLDLKVHCLVIRTACHKITIMQQEPLLAAHTHMAEPI